MSLKNGNTVERRMDLASLFCMIGRHGPAVALAVIAVVSVVAGFVIYRTVKGKRRKARAGGDGGPGEERDEALIQTEETSPEEPRRPTESTDVSDERLSDDDLKIRHRRPTAEQKPPPENNLLPDNSSAVQDEAAENNQRRETWTAAGVEDDGRHQELQLTDKESCTEEEKVLPAECQEDVTADKDLYDEDNLQYVLKSSVCCEQKLHMSENRERDDEATPDTNKTESHLEEPIVHIEDVHVSSVCYSKDPENHHPQDTSHSNYYSNDLLSPEEEVKNVEVEDGQVIAQQAGMVYSTSEQETNQSDVTEEVLSNQNSDQDHECGQTSEESQEDVQEDLLSSLPDVHFDANMLQQHLQTEQNHGEGLTWNKEDHVVKGEVEEETIPVLDKETVLEVPDLTSLKEELQSEKTETESVDQEGNLPSSQQELCDDVKAEVVLSSQESDQREDLKEDHLNDHTNVGLKDGLPCNQEDGAVKGEMLASCDEERESSSVVLTPALPEKFDSSDDGLCGATTDAEAQISGVVDFPDLSSDHQQAQSKVKEEEITTVLHQDAHLDVLATDLSSLKEEIQSEKNQGSVDQEANLPSSQLEQCEVTVGESDLNDGRGLNSKRTGDMNEGHVKDLTNVRCDPPALQQQQAELQDGGVKDEMLTSLDEEPEPEKVDGVCGTTGEPRCVDFPNLSSNIPLSVKEDETAPAVDTNADLHILSQDVPSFREEIQSERKEIDTAVVLAEETVHVESSSYKDQHSDSMDNKESLDKMGDQASSTAPVLSTETSHPDVPSSFQDKQSDQNNADLPEVTAGAAPVINKPPICQVQLPSFEQSELTWSSSGFGGESGVSSMTVSPDMENLMNEILIPENADLPVEDSDPQTEAQINLSADDGALSVAKEDAADLVSKSCPPHLSLQPHSEPTDWAKDESFATNEDTFGHEVEDSYNRAMDQFLVEIAAEVKHDEKKKQTDVKAVETKKKEGAKEEEEEEEYEKTEISIMEATMDNNEWITDGNYQVLPWMSFSVPSFTQSHTKTEPVPREERLHSSSPAEAPCIDTVIPLPVVEQTNTVPLLDESLDNSKKVVAVQPMPQNVNVIFRIHYHTHSPYQKVAVTGNQQELGNWKEFIPLERSEDGQWSSVVSLPAESHVEWKFVVLDKGDVCRWEECGNRLLDTGSGDELLVHRWWGIL